MTVVSEVLLKVSTQKIMKPLFTQICRSDVHAKAAIKAKESYEALREWICGCIFINQQLGKC